MMEEMILLEELQGRAENFRSRLEWHKARVGQLRARAAMEFDDQMTSLRQELQEAREQIRRMASTGQGAWVELESMVDRLWRDLTEEFETATTRF